MSSSKNGLQLSENDYKLAKIQQRIERYRNSLIEVRFKKECVLKGFQPPAGKIPAVKPKKRKPYKVRKSTSARRPRYSFVDKDRL